MSDKKNYFGIQPSALLKYHKKRILKARSALDIGCAHGANAYYLAKLGIHVDALDKNLPTCTAHPLIKFTEMDITNFSFKKKYDVIMAFNVLQFLSAPEKYAVLERAQSSLTPGGVIFIQSFTRQDPSYPNSKHIKSHFARHELLSWAKEKQLEIISHHEKIIHDNHEPLGKHRHGIVSLVARQRS